MSGSEGWPREERWSREEGGRAVGQGRVRRWIRLPEGTRPVRTTLPSRRPDACTDMVPHEEGCLSGTLPSFKGTEGAWGHKGGAERVQSGYHASLQGP